MKILILLFIVVSLVTPLNSVKAELPPKIKVLLLTSTYGAVAGALLGTASLAFKAPGRSVAKGASLGLYAGIIFGTYVIVSHGRKNQPGYEQAPAGDPNSPYGDDSPYSNDYYGSGLYDGHKEQTLTKKRSTEVPLYINIANINF